MQISLYATINIFCIIVCAIILYRRVASLDKQKDHKLFNTVIISSIVFFVFDMLWGLSDSNMIPKTPFLSYILNAFYFLCIGFAACVWFIYSEKQQSPSIIKNKKILYLIWIPFGIYSILVILSYFFNSVFYIDELGEYHRGYLYPVQLLLCYGYMVVTSIKALVLSFRKEYYDQQRKLLTLATFALFPVIFGTLQAIFYGLPTVSMGIALAILQAHTHFQEQLISIDPLTQINNRNEMIKYLSNKIKEKKTDFILFILDLDDFKSVNDEYGHVEGDKALIRVAHALKKFAAKYNAFISRYAGDEFIIICDSNGLDSIIVSKEINTFLKEELSIAQVEYELHLSVGMAKHCNEINTIPELLEKADTELYENKGKRSS